MKPDKIQSWIDEGLITETQGQAILQFEADTNRPYGFYITLGLGFFAIALGVISLIAANWDDISATTKIICYFATYSGIGVGLVYFNESRKNLAEGLSFLFFFMTIAGIGLIAQIFNLTSNGWSAFCFWTAVTLPLATLSERKLLPTFWWAIYFISSLLWLFNSPDWTYKPAAFVALWLLPMLLGPLFSGAQTPLLLNFRTPTRVFGSVIFWVIIPTVLDIAANAAAKIKGLENPGTTALVLGIIGLLYIIQIMLTRPREDHWLTRLEIANIVLPFVLLILLCFDPLPLLTGKVAGAAQYLCVLTLASFYTYRAREFQLFNVLTFLIAVRLMVIYLQVFGSLLSMGFGLIFSGCVVLIIAYGWFKIRQYFNPTAEGEG